MYANFAEQKTLIVIEDSQDRLPIVGDQFDHQPPKYQLQGISYFAITKKSGEE